MGITDDSHAVRDQLPHPTRRLALRQANTLLVLPDVT
jgi:hypothetical protein